MKAMRGPMRTVTCVCAALTAAWLASGGPATPQGESGDPPWYTRQATWHQTLRASREALLRQEQASGKGSPLPSLGECDFTITAWVRTTAGGVLFSRSSPDGRWACQGKCWFIHNGRLGYDIGCVGVYGARTPIADGEWHHVALTYSHSASSIRFYVDGQPDGEASARGNPDIPGDVFRIGAAAPGFAEPNAFTGEIDEVRLYRRVLSPDEIRARAEMPGNAREADCVGCWHLDGDAADASGNGHHGQVVGARPVGGRFGQALQFDGSGQAVLIPSGDGVAERERIWDLLRRDFPDAKSEMSREREDRIWANDWEPGDFGALAARYVAACHRVPAVQAEARQAAGRDEAALLRVRALYHRSRRVADVVAALRGANLPAVRRAVADLTQTCGAAYPKGREHLARLAAAEREMPRIQKEAERGNLDAVREGEAILSLRREALLANPLLRFDRLLLIRRDPKQLGLPQNWESNSSLPQTGYDNEICILSPVRPEGKIVTLFRPPDGRFVGDVDLHWDADRLLFSMPGDNGRWQVFEMRTDGTGLHPLPLISEPDVDNYDACYLPNGRILFTSTAPFVGVPCVTGASHVSNLYLLEAPGRIRRLTFEQDHDWCPTVLNNGRVLYLRWEYSDLPHFVSRILFTMNPDGTEQREHYGSNSYWPNALFYARPVPGHPTQFVAIVGGHHDVPRMGELVLFDPAKGRHEADGVVQRIPGFGNRVEPVIRDGLVGGSWPKFLHPWPLSGKYFLVSAQPAPEAPWGIYLVDVFDNMLLLHEMPGSALLEPIPLVRRPVPPVIPNRVDATRKDAVVSITDIYAGPGLRGVPRGTVKRLRLFTYHFAYHGMGGQVNRVGLDGPWDIKRIIGTVPVEPDGSARFRVPANTPISLQPLDAEGKALQLMRSWMTAMPGEEVSCVGCHEAQNATIPNRRTLALRRPPSAITPWYGPTRGFSFRREVQPVLNRYCVSCHDEYRDRPDVHPQAGDATYNAGTHFPPSYLALRAYVRTPTIESDMHLLEPCEYHADTTRLVRLLKKGHYGVRLDSEAWDRLITWIDLNTPAHGTWGEIVGSERVAHQRDRRRTMDRLYAGVDEDPEAPWVPPSGSSTRVTEGEATSGVRLVERAMAPERAAAASRNAGARIVAAASPPASAEKPAVWRIDLGEGVHLELVRVPAGEFTMGDAEEPPVHRVRIVRPFWIGRCEVTNAQFARFDPRHDSRLETGDFLQFSEQERGYPVNTPQQPVCRVSWREADAFCRWLSRQTGRQFALPTEAEWEYACRAGTSTPLWYGDIDADFGAFDNLADHSLRFVDTFGWGLPSGAVPLWRPAIESVRDGHRVSAPVGSYRPNPWGLFDVHGNVAEWTRSATPGRAGADERVVRGGSWYDRPKEARSAARTVYPAWRKVYDVGFRVMCYDRRPGRVAAR